MTPKEKKQFIELLRHPHKLHDGWRCPACKQDFKECRHSWTDVRRANDRTLERLLP